MTVDELAKATVDAIGSDRSYQTCLAHEMKRRRHLEE